MSMWLGALLMESMMTWRGNLTMSPSTVPMFLKCSQIVGFDLRPISSMIFRAFSMTISHCSSVSA